MPSFILKDNDFSISQSGIDSLTIGFVFSSFFLAADAPTFVGSVFFYYNSGIFPLSFNLNTDVSSPFADFTTAWRLFPSFYLKPNDFSIGSLCGFSSGKSALLVG